jgi:hypothetical protein
MNSAKPEARASGFGGTGVLAGSRGSNHRRHCRVRGGIRGRVLRCPTPALPSWTNLGRDVDIPTSAQRAESEPGAGRQRSSSAAVIRPTFYTLLAHAARASVVAEAALFDASSWLSSSWSTGPPRLDRYREALAVLGSRWWWMTVLPSRPTVSVPMSSLGRDSRDAELCHGCRPSSRPSR